MLAVGEHLWGEVDEQTQRISCAFGGGIGGTTSELCGALSGSVLLIGALYGRTAPDEDDTQCYQMAADYREQFLQRFGMTRCDELRASGYGADGKWPCSMLVERAAHLLLDLLASQA